MQIPDIDAITRCYDHVVVSPHFDDAVASCGGWIIDRLKMGETVLIATVFTSHITGKKPFRKKAYRKLLDYDQRRAEDNAAMVSLGVDFIWLGYREFLFRENIPLFRYWPCFRKTPVNVALSHALASDFLDICRKTGCKNLILPMAVGQHMDHQVVFQAGTHLLNKENETCRIIFYEDYPYVLFPNMLYYRMKITGWLRMVPQNKNGICKPIQPSSYRNAVDLLSGTPSFKLGAKITKPLYLLFILIFGLYTHYLLKTSRNMCDKGWIFSQETYDISHTIDRKLDAIMAYQSQLTRPVLNRGRIKNAMRAYSESGGFSKDRFCERYGKLGPATDSA
jgi:LmbE family N-acetylglucosaminyl deacetylase